MRLICPSVGPLKSKKVACCINFVGKAEKLLLFIRTKLDPSLANSLAVASPIPADAPVLSILREK